MEKKNTILLTVIAIATLLVAVIGATFAYFATSQNINANIPVSVNTEGNQAQFISSAIDSSIIVNVTAENMLENTSSGGTANTSDTANITVSLKAAGANQTAVCTYDIIFTWSSNKYNYSSIATTGNGGKVTGSSGEVNLYNEFNTDQQYVRTRYLGDSDAVTPVTKELTISANGVATDGGSGTTSSEISNTDITGNGVGPTSTNVTMGANNEHNFDEFKVETNSEGKGYMTLFKGLKIESSSATTATTVKWDFTVRFYNATHDQSIQMGKSFAGNISVSNVVC